MSIYTIADLHLSLGGGHSMEIFPGWENYVERIQQRWRAKIRQEDLVVLPGDISWGMTLEQALPDFRFLADLPGRKLLLKGNHDYWWSTRAKIEAFFQQNGLTGLEILHNSCVRAGGFALCGSRGWLFETGEPADAKLIRREAIRLSLSLQEAEKTGLEPLVFLHYPPVYGDSRIPELLEVLHTYGVRRCYYGHIHAEGCRWAFQGELDGVRYRLVSSDYLRFDPLLVEP